MPKPTAYSSQLSVPLPDDESVRAIAGQGFDTDTALNVLKMFAGTQEFYPALVGMVQAVFGTPDIDATRREVIILRAATVLRVPYEWQANEKMARNAGLPQQSIDAIAVDGPVTGLDPESTLLCRATDELLGRGTLEDATLRELLDRYGATITRKYVVTIAWFSLLSLFLNGTRVPLETTDKIGDRTSPLR